MLSRRRCAAGTMWPEVLVAHDGQVRTKLGIGATRGEKRRTCGLQRWRSSKFITLCVCCWLRQICSAQGHSGMNQGMTELSGPASAMASSREQGWARAPLRRRDSNALFLVAGPGRPGRAPKGISDALVCVEHRRGYLPTVAERSICSPSKTR